MASKPQFESLSSEDLLRINVVGTSGIGKSTLAKRLVEILNCEYIEMDRYYHGPNWTETPTDIFESKIRDALESDRWILDGNYHSKTFKTKWARATMIVWLDMSFSRNFYRAVTRALNRAWTKKELWPNTGNRETFRTLFSRDSIVLWTVITFRKLRKRYSAIEKSPPPNVKFVRLRTPRDVEQFVSTVEASTKNGSSPAS